MRGKVLGIGVLCVAVVCGFWQTAAADRFTSTSYVIDASVTNNIGGNQTSSSYKLTGSGGESLIGNGSSGSYKTGIGYVAQ